MELSHLLQLVSELPENSTLNYVRGTDTCKFIDVDIVGERINSETPTGEPKSWAPSYLSELAPKILENVPFNLSGLLNNKGSFRPVLETIIAHTREFYTVRKGTATALVWIPSKPKNALNLEEIDGTEIPAPSISNYIPLTINKEDIANALKSAFIKYFTNYLQLSTGKSKDDKMDFYLGLYQKHVEKPINELDENFKSIFHYETSTALNLALKRAAAKDVKFQILLSDSWPKDKEDQTLYYEPWTMIRHYRNFLDMLADFNQVALSINPKLATIPQIKDEINSSISHADYLRAMRTKPFLLLAGISGTGKSRIVKQMAFDSCPEGQLREDETSPGNYCLIEVKPNWHDSTELLGYESKIGGEHYVLTPFVKFLAKAMLHPNIPFFVCLDEMNLAPVEQYFAEFLSVLESRTKLDNGHIVSEPLIKADIFHKYPALAKDLFSLEEKSDYNGNGTSDPAAPYGKEAEVYETLKREGVRIPENVIVIGTVNMDETTHQFSRKVIDRAMTIEMNLPDGNPFMDFYNNSSQLIYRENPTSPSSYLSTEVKASDVIKLLAADNAEKTEWLKGEVAKFLNDLNANLDGTPFKVAYRVQNELLLYFYQSWLEDKSAKWRDILTSSCDRILMMKVLPRIEGDEELLEQPLEKLHQFFEYNDYKESKNKIVEMQSRLEKAHFTSFWP